MKLFLSGLVLIFLCHISNSQDKLEWYWQSPLPQGHEYTGVEIVDHDSIFAYGEDGTIIRTSDSGFNWTIYELPVKDWVEDLKFFNKNIGLAITDTTIFKTTDGGATWTVVYHSNSGLFREFCITSDTSAYILGPSKLFFTDNLGETWNIIQTPNAYYSRNCIFFINDKEGWISLYGEDYPSYEYKNFLYSTDNGGISWQLIKHPCGNLSRGKKMHRTNSNRGWYACEGALYKTLNNGASWGRTFNYYGSGEIDFSDNNNYYIKTSIYNGGGVIWRSQDQGTMIWEMIESGIERYSKTFIYDSTFWFRTIGNHIYKTPNAGQEWIELSSGLQHDIKGLYFLNENLGWSWLTDGDEIKLFKSTNAGYDWNEIYTKITDTSINTFSLYFYPQFLDSLHVWAYYIKGSPSMIQRLMKSIDGGKTWTYVEFPEDIELCLVQAVTDQTIWIAGKHGEIYLSFNGGEEWLDRSIYGFYEPKSTKSLLHYSDTQVWIGNGRRIFFSSNMGQTWQEQCAFHYADFRNITFFNNSYGIASSYKHIYYTYNGGANWWGIPALESDIRKFQCLDSKNFYYFGDDTKLYKSSNSGWDWEIIEAFTDDYKSFYFLDTLTGWVWGENRILRHTKPEPPPPSFIGEYNYQLTKKLKIYPNPVENVLNIEHPDINNRSYKLSIYDMSGRIMYSDEIGNGNKHFINQISVENLTEGIYIVCLEQKGKTYTSKFIKQ